MASSFPGGLDAFTNPTGSDNLSTSVGGRTHSQMHRDENDAIENIQGELGTNPSAGWVTLKDRVNARDRLIFDVMDPTYGAAVDGSTDDTAAWQAAINACATAGGGMVTSSKNGVSVIAGALQDTSGANAQLVLPSLHALDAEQITVVIGGLTPPPAVFSVVGATPLPDNHLVLKSTLASGTGAVIGAKGPVGTYQEFTMLHVRVQNLTVRTVSNPTISALDLRRVTSVDIESVVVDCGNYNIATLTEPTSTGSYGIRLPANNNGAHVRLGNVDVIGFYTGYEFAEHATGVAVGAHGCKVGAEFDTTNHASTFLRFVAHWCPRVVKFTGAHPVDFWQLDVEHATTGWWAPVYDIDDASNYGSGFVRWWSILAGTGPHAVFTVNGGSGLTLSRVGAAIGSGGGTTTYVYRDRLVAAAGNNTLTLGATPVTNSPLVWVNGTIKWPTTDYTIATNVITFGSGLSASDVVAVHYTSTASSASAAALTTSSVTIVDTFTRADSTSALGSTTTGAKAWTQHAGTWGISSNKAYLSNGVSGLTCLATVDASTVGTSRTISAVMTGANLGGFIFRSDGAGNSYVVEFDIAAVTAPKIYKQTAGSFSIIATGSSTTIASGSVMSIVLSGSSITVKDDGVTIVSVTDATWNANTRDGLYAAANTGVSSALRWDDFTIA